MKRTIVTNPVEIHDIIKKCLVCHVAMVDADGMPYVVPLNFGFRDGVIYLHSSQHGKKIDILKNNPHVCIEFSTDYMLRFQSEEVACSYSMKYRSVLATGEIEFIDDPDQKIAAMNIVMNQYSPREFTFNPPSIREVCCYRVNVRKLEGRVFGY